MGKKSWHFVFLGSLSSTRSQEVSYLYDIFFLTYCFFSVEATVNIFVAVIASNLILCDADFETVNYCVGDRYLFCKCLFYHSL
jgi:hypothetical protein